MGGVIKKELVKYVLEAEARELNFWYEHYATYDDWAPADATPEDRANARGRKEATNDAVASLNKLAELLS